MYSLSFTLYLFPKKGFQAAVQNENDFGKHEMKDLFLGFPEVLRALQSVELPQYAGPTIHEIKLGKYLFQFHLQRN